MSALMEMDFLWTAVPAGLQLLDGGVHVFCAPLDVPAERLEELVQPLSEDEWRRAERFHLERDRKRFLAGRGTLREILGTLLSLDPKSFVFTYGEFGKPELAAPPAARFYHFNVAHSDAIAVYAIAPCEIGVDIERRRPVEDAEQIASRFFSTREERCLRSLPVEHREEAFFNCWTRKEAYLKAIGLGLHDCLNQVEVSLLPDERPELFSAPAESQTGCGWFFHALAPAPEFTGAVAFQKKDAPVSCWMWT